ncbi:putative RNA-directed DNA polymerase from transposon X-element [Trichonephila clavipes]|nr:putative RNA-directed DNA polymerase from transposon X-element [Trichonephila clavipes]
MEGSSGQSFIPTDLGRVNEEMILQGNFCYQAEGEKPHLIIKLCQRISATNREPTFTVPLTNHNSAIQTIQDFTAETVCKKNSDSVATPSCHVRPTNQDTHSQAGPPTSGHIHYLDMGWRNASRSKLHLRPADRVSIPNYTCHRSDRTTHRGGGTALFVKNSIRHHAILNVSNTFENASIILQLGNNSKITVACIYRPPHGSINTTELDAILIHSNKAFLFGDFNARHPSWNPGRANSNGNILCTWAVGSALDILAPDTPTHFNSRHSNAILDIGFAVNLSHTEVFTINTL